MSSLLAAITQQIDGDVLRQLAAQTQAEENDVQEAASLALASLVGGLSRNASRPGGAESLLGALLRDHDGSLFENLGSFLGQPDLRAGHSILEHVFAGRHQEIAHGLSEETGLDIGVMLRLLATLAPLVMGYLGREQRRHQLGSEELTRALLGEREAVETQANGGLELLTRLLDRDGDGQAADDVASLGRELLAGLADRR